MSGAFSVHNARPVQHQYRFMNNASWNLASYPDAVQASGPTAYHLTPYATPRRLARFMTVRAKFRVPPCPRRARMGGSRVSTMRYAVRSDGNRCVGCMVQAARKRISRRRRAVRMRLVKRSAGSHAVGHVPVLVEGVTGRILGISSQRDIQGAASLDLESAEARADVTTATERRNRGRDQIATWAGVNAVGCRRHLRRVASMIDAAPERVPRRVGDLAGSHGERRARRGAMRHIGVLSVPAGAVCLDLGAVGRTVEGGGRGVLDRGIDGRIIVTAAYQGHHVIEWSRTSRFLQLSTGKAQGVAAPAHGPVGRAAV
jgi:CBS domain-containing protein